MQHAAKGLHKLYTIKRSIRTEVSLIYPTILQIILLIFAFVLVRQFSEDIVCTSHKSDNSLGYTIQSPQDYPD